MRMKIILKVEIMTMINSILNKIGISSNSESYYIFDDNSWKSKIPIRFHRGLVEIKPHSFIILENKIITESILI